MHWQLQRMDRLFFATDGLGVQLIPLRSDSTNRKLQIILFVERSFGFGGRSFYGNKVRKVWAVECNFDRIEKQGRRVFYWHCAEPLQFWCRVDQGPPERSLHSWKHTNVTAGFRSWRYNLSMGELNKKSFFIRLLRRKTWVRRRVRRLDLTQPAKGAVRLEPLRVLHPFRVGLKDLTRGSHSPQAVLKPFRQGPDWTDIKLYRGEYLRPVYIKTPSQTQKHRQVEVA